MGHLSAKTSAPPGSDLSANQHADHAVLGALRKRLMNPVLFRDFAAAFTAEWNRLQAETSAGLAGKRQELERVERKRGEEARLPARAVNMLGRLGAGSFEPTLWSTSMTVRLL